MGTQPRQAEQLFTGSPVAFGFAQVPAFLAGRLRSTAAFFRRLAGVMTLTERLKIRIRMIVPGQDVVNVGGVVRASPAIRQKGPAAKTITLENVGTLLPPVLGEAFTPGGPRPALSQLTHSKLNVDNSPSITNTDSEFQR